MQINQNLLKQMIKNVADPRLREAYATAISGKYPFNVYCMNPQILKGEKKPAHKAGLLVGYMTARGKIVIDEPTFRKVGKHKRPIAGIKTSRDRLDGVKGFSCWCGNSSIVAREEADIMVPGHVPDSNDMSKIYQRLQKRGPNPIGQLGGTLEYDGFKVEEVAV